MVESVPRGSLGAPQVIRAARARLHTRLRAAKGASPELAAGALAIAAALYVAGTKLRRGFPLDDAWIHMQYGLSLARHGVVGYNDGVSSTGCTSPSWVIVAALAHLLAAAKGPSMAAALGLKAMGMVAFAVSAAASARLARAISPRGPGAACACAAGALVAATPLLAYAAVSGMEVPLASALLVSSFFAAVRGRALGAGTLAGLAAITRPEAVVVVPGVVLLVWLASSRRPVMRALVAAAASAVPLGAVALRTLVVSGRPLPATFYVKANPGAQTLGAALRRGFVDLLGVEAPTSRLALWATVAGAVVVGGLSAWRRVRTRRAEAHGLRGCAVGLVALSGLAYVAGASLVMVIEYPRSFYYQRYLAPALPLLAVAGVSGLAWVVRRIATYLARTPPPSMVSVVALVVPALLVADELRAWPAHRAAYRASVTGIDEIQVALGRFIDGHVPADGVVWSVDAGAIRYFGRRTTVDLVRLNTPEVFHEVDVDPRYAPDAVVTIPREFLLGVEPDGLLELAGVAEPSSGTKEERSLVQQQVYVCVAERTHDERGRVAVLKKTGGELLLIARSKCRER